MLNIIEKIAEDEKYYHPSKNYSRIYIREKKNYIMYFENEKVHLGERSLTKTLKTKIVLIIVNSFYW